MRLRCYLICCLKPALAVDEAVITGGCSPTCNVKRTDEDPGRELSMRSSFTCNYIKGRCDDYGATSLALGPTEAEGSANSSRCERALAKTCTHESADDCAAYGFDSARSDRQAELRDAVAAAVRATVTPALTGLPQLRPLLRDLTLDECIGAGRSGGKVFKGMWQGRDAAIKLTVSSSVDHLHVTAREALLSRSLSHPHLVQTYAVHVAQLSRQDLDPDTYLLPDPTADPARWMGGLAGLDDSRYTDTTIGPLTPRGSTQADAALFPKRSVGAEQDGAVGSSLPTAGSAGYVADRGMHGGGSGGGSCGSSGGGGGASGAGNGSSMLAAQVACAGEGSTSQAKEVLPVQAVAAVTACSNATTGAPRQGQHRQELCQASPAALPALKTLVGSNKTSCVAPQPDAVGVEPTTVSQAALNPSRELVTAPAPAPPPALDSNAARFLRELQAMGAAPGRYLTCLVMELCDQGTLLHLIDNLHQGRAGDKTLQRYRARNVRMRPGVIRQALPLREPWSTDFDSGGPHCRPPLLFPSAPVELEAARAAADEPAEGTAHSPEALRMLWIALDIARGMNHLHAEDLIHVDLKPGNVLLSRASLYGEDPDTGGGPLPRDTTPRLLSGGARPHDFRCKVADFGLTTPTSAASSKLGGSFNEGASSDLGAVAYLSPEVAAGALPDKPADVYSYGALLWHLVTGVKPHASLRRSQIVVGLASGQLTLTWPHWSEPTLRKIGSACMAPEPARRPTFEHIVRELEQVVQAAASGGIPAARTDCIPPSQQQGSAAMNLETP